MECVAVHHGLDNAHGSSEEPMEFSHSGVSPSDKCAISHHINQTPSRFSNPATIKAPESLRELVSQLHEVFEGDHISVEYVQTLMSSYTSKPREWKRYAKFDPHRYTRNLVDVGNGKFNLMVLCWNEGQGSSIHSHANSHCFLKVIGGSVKEELYQWPSPKQLDADNSNAKNEDNEDGGKVMKKWAENAYAVNECAYINDSIGLHRVENTSHTDKAVTLHLYSPPFDECQCFDERTGQTVTAKVTFWSKFGRRTPFGRCPDTAINSCPGVKN